LDVVLINPPQLQLAQPRAYIPLGLAYLGAVLVDANITVEVVNLADKPIEDVTINTFPDATLYGISCNSATYPAVIEISRILKEYDRKLVIGGIHPSIFPNKVLQETKCDYVITGEGEYALRDLALGKTSNKIINAGLIKNLDELPLPRRQLFAYADVVDYTGIHGQEKGVGGTTILTSRGCPYNCSFCCKIPQTKKMRYHSPRHVVKELKQVMATYGVSHFRFIDDIFTLQKRRIETLCNLIIKDGLHITWVCITRADKVNESLLKTMRDAGCIEVHIGCESGSQRVLDSMNKRITVRQNIEAIHLIKKVGMRAKVYLMTNYPGETEADVEMTKKFMEEARPDKYTLSTFVPFPGSRVYESYKGNNPRSMWFYPDEKGCRRYIELKKWLESGVWKG